MQLTFTFTDGATPSDIAAHLRFQAGVFEGLAPKVASSKKNTQAAIQAFDAEDDETEPAEVVIAKSPRAAKTKTKAEPVITSFDDSDEDELDGEGSTETDSFDDDFEDDEVAAPAPKAKAKKEPKITIADVNDACKARAKSGGKEGRAQVLKILKKQFKTESVSELKPEQYGAVIKAMAV